MEAVTISVQNLATDLISDDEAAAIARALDAQAKNDYGGSSWVKDELATPIAEVVLIESGAAPPPDTWHLEILLNSDQPGALGYHEEERQELVLQGGEEDETAAAADGLLRKASHHSSRGLREDNPGLPLMKVFAQTAEQDKASLAEVCSHEMLEAAVDPRPMKEPRKQPDPGNGRVYIVEVGDPVQECGYEVEGQTVADFALPAWYGIEQRSDPADQMSFRSSVSEAFKLAPGGYTSFYIDNGDGKEDWQQEQGS